MEKPVKSNTDMTKAEKISKELHKPITKVFKRRSILANHKDEIWAADLCVMDTIDKGFKYILTVIDVYTRFCFAQPLTKKTGEVVKTAFEQIFDEWERIPKFLFTDKGTEFYNSTMKTLLSKHKIQLYSTQSELKASICERMVKTLKHKMERVVTAKNILQEPISWSEILIDIVYDYNYKDKHGFLKTTPALASEDFFQDALKILWYPVFTNSTVTKNHLKQTKFHVGDFVRLYKYKTHFEKGFKANFTNEIFRIQKILPTFPFTYIIEDSKGESIIGGVYEQELAKTDFTF